MQSVILYRNTGDWEFEHEYAAKYFKCISNRAQISTNQLIIPRYSALPFYKELEEEVNYKQARLINSYYQHQYVADLKNWYYDLQEYTPKTWFRLEDIPEEGPFVLKGETNSKKNYWNTHMFAKNKREAIQVHSNLCADSLIGEQEIYVREFVPLKTYIEGIQGQPITHEYRVFACFGEILSMGYYWSNYYEDIQLEDDPPPNSLIQTIVDKTKDNINFVVIDLAKAEDNEWVLIELNDGSMSGISENEPESLYLNLKRVVEKNVSGSFFN